VQLGHMTELQVKAHKDAAREHKKDLTEEREAERVYHKELKEEIAEEIRLREEAHKFGQGQTPEQRQAYAAQQEMVRQAAEAQRRVDRMLIEDARQLDQALKEIHKEHLQFPLDVDKQAAAITSALPKFSAWTAEIRQAKEITKEFTSATAQSAIATMFQGIAAGESFKRVAHEAVASIAKQAGIQAVWEAAQGFAMLALSFFMPNPAYVASADAHFTAAAIYGGIGGAAAGIAAGMRSPRGAGAGGGGAETGYGPTGGSGRGDGGSLTPQTLAPGVSSQAGRFGSPGSGVVIIRGTQAFEDFTAAAVNAAHARGVTINATFASRGAPVGH